MFADPLPEDDAIYTVSFEASSLDIERIANGPEVFGEEYVDIYKVGNSVAESLDGFTYELWSMADGTISELTGNGTIWEIAGRSVL